ncbi:MAG: MFS transporter [Galactobacter sp.]
MTSAPTSPPQPTLNTKDMRRILGSSFLGSMIEYYDFMLYATCASIVFGKVFFADLNPGMALFASFATLAVGYFIRPLGGIVFGHFGDLVGRKKMLVISLLLMGGVTVCIGLLPTTEQIGVAAPILLILLRLVQGFAVGGEWGGAALMALEHAPRQRRGFAASFANAGSPAGAITATLVLSLMTVISGDQFLVWGWRVPFLLSAVLVIIGLVIRAKVAESPVFKELDAEAESRKMPILEVLQKHWKPVLIATAAVMSFYVTQGIVTVWGVSYAVGHGEPQNVILNWKAAGACITLITTFLAARASDRFGRRRMLLVAGAAAVIGAFPLVQAIGTGTTWGFAVAVVLGNGIIQGLCYGPIAAFVAEQFPARIRYTGASLAYQGAAAIGAGFTPMIAAALVLVPGSGLWWVGAFWAVTCGLSALAVLAAPRKPVADVELEAQEASASSSGAPGRRTAAMDA